MDKQPTLSIPAVTAPEEYQTFTAKRSIRRSFLTKAAGSLAGTGLLLAASRQSSEAATEINHSSNPAQNLKMFCVTDLNYVTTTTGFPSSSIAYYDATGTLSTITGVDFDAFSSSVATANTLAINTAIKACGESGGGIVYFPPGKYYVNSPIIVPYNGVTLMGAGVSATYIYAAPSFSGNALVYIGDPASTTFNPNNCWVKNITLSYNTLDGLGVILEFYNASFCGGDNVQTYGRNHGIWFNGFYNCKLNNCQAIAPMDQYGKPGGTGSSLRINGFSGQHQGADLWIGGGCLFTNNTNGVWISGDAGGVQIEDSDIINNKTGILINSTATGGASSSTDFNPQICIGHCWIDSSQFNGIYVGDYGVDTLLLNGTWIASSGQHGMLVTATQTTLVIGTSNGLAMNFSGCRIFQNANNGLLISGGKLLNIGSSTIDFNGLGTGGGHGVNLSSTSLNAATIVGNLITLNGNSGVYVVSGLGNPTSVAGGLTITGNNTLNNGYTSGGACTSYNTSGQYGKGVQMAGALNTSYQIVTANL